ncbi:MAG: 6-phosphogluconolactonase [Chloroflexi bacterium]|nr:6-phosphogluconolactonase [Chloroflexota bacterium]
MSERLILPDAAAVAQTAADRFVALARSAITANGQFTVALSGGATPKAMLTRLIDRPIDWVHVHVFWGDERCVSSEDVDSNYRMACKALLKHVPIPEQNVHRMQGEINPTQAASNYTAELRAMFGRVEWPRFDLVLLGLGIDAHTASLFPGTGAIHEGQRWVVGHFVENLKAYRLTLTPPVINHAEHVIFLVAGADKAAALQSVFSHTPIDPDQFPAQIVQPVAGTLTWLIDQIAAAQEVTS